MYLSPSETHQHVMKRIAPALRYAGGDVRAWQRKLRRKLRGRVGLDALPKERGPLRSRRLWRREHPLGVIEKIVFRSEPRADVPAYVCLPKDAEPPYACMICVQGHNSGMHHSIGVQREDESQPMAVEGDRDFALQCMRHGVAALCIEQRSFGERREQKQAARSKMMCHEAAAHALMLGRTLVGERVFDVDRGIDYLAARGDMDLRAVGIMGNSGGGTTSLFSAALLRRIAFAVPSCYFCSFRASIMSLYHCTCNYVPGLLQVAEMSDVLGLFAPRPVVIVAGEKDDIFPVRATRKAFSELRRIYEACGARDRCHLVVGKGGHRFYADAAWPVMMQSISQIRE